MKFIRKFKGNSNSHVFLVEESGHSLVYKTMLKNAELCAAISKELPFPTPEIYQVTDQSILMEYIPGIDIKQYLSYASTEDLNKLVFFLADYIEYSLATSYSYNFEQELKEKVNELSDYIDVEQHVCQFPQMLPRGSVHGDLTLENIIFYNNKFYFIDAHYTNLNSVYFDANKLRQDLNGYWFLREESKKMNYVSSCEFIYKKLTEKFKDLFDKNAYAFMLARILPYCKRDLEKDLILSEIKKCRS